MSNVDRTAYNIVPPNSFAYNPARINVGSLGYYEGTENVIVSSLYEVFQTEEYIDDKFLLHWFKSDSFPRWIEKLQEGSVRLYFYFDKLVQCQMMVPSLEEQKRISAYLDSIDQLITLHQCKSNFCKKNEVNAWEQRKVSEIADRFDNLRVPVAANLRTPGTTPYYGANGIQDYVEGYTHDGEFVLVAEDGANDLKNYPVKCVNGRIWVNNHAHVLQARPQIASNQFLAYSMSQANIEALLVGGGRAKLNAEVMMGIVLRIPRLQEQEVIGGYFYKLDQLITLHQWECNINENTEGNDEKQRKPIKKLIISEGNLSLVDDMFLLHRMTFLVCNKYILLRLNVVKYKITIIIISNILYSIVSLLIIACYLIVINKQLIILIYVEISVVIIKGDDDYARIRS